MAKYKNGINGPLSGKVGFVVAASWNGIDYLRSLPVGYKVATKAQLNMRRLMGLVSGWLRPLKGVIAVGFQDVPVGRTPMNEAVSFVFKHALTGDGANRMIDFSRVVFSRGVLVAAMVSEVFFPEAGLLRVSWVSAPSSALCAADDRVCFVFYCAGLERFVVFSDVAARADGLVVLELPADLNGFELHGWMQLVSVDGGMVSTSVYICLRADRHRRPGRGHALV